MSCGCALQSVHVSVVVVVGSILCRYVRRTGDLFVRNCASILRVFLSRCFSLLCMSGAIWLMILLCESVLMYCET